MAKSELKTTRVRVGETDSWIKLMALRDLTRKTGALHESQVIQLKMWPLVFLNVKDSTCEFGFETKQVIYKTKKFAGRKPSNFKKRLEHLVDATQRLLGPEYGVVIMLDGKKVHYGAATSDE